MKQEHDQAVEIASKFVNSTNHNIFLTGRAGTGKTTFLRDISRRTHKNTIVAAPTGIAAINAEGVTLHSLFQLPFGAFIPMDRFDGHEAPDFQLHTPRTLHQQLKMYSAKRSLLKKLELLIIDEVSMLRADILDAVDSVLRRVRRRQDLPFGGVQVLFIGDLQQLPPVVKNNEWQVLQQYYPSMFFFSAQVLREEKPLYIELTKIYRQTDNAFISVLNRLRDNRMTAEDIETLNRCYKPGFSAAPGEGYVYLTTHNYKADRINQDELRKLPGNPVEYHAEIDGEFDPHIHPVDPVLALKKNAQVMFIKNDPTGDGRFFNGKIGRVDELDENGFNVVFSDGAPPVWVEQYTWENKRYTLNKKTNEIEEKTAGVFVHFPIKLAWAITVHKSQGLTFEKAVIDVSRAFAAGQVYVAFSRLTSLKGLVLTSPFRRKDIPAEPALREFADLKNDISDLDRQFQTASTSYLREEVLQTFNFVPLCTEFDYHLRTYTKDAIRSEKQKSLPWARDLYSELIKTKQVADKFLIQLNRILHPESDSDYAYLRKRVQAARDYFEPILTEFSKKIASHVEELQTGGKGVKKYITELKNLDLLIYGRLQGIYKAGSLIDAFIHDTELTRGAMHKPPARNANAADAGRKTNGRKKKTPKAKKPDTKTLTLELFNAGKTIKEIAAERGLATSTIETHLAFWIGEGVVDIKSLMPQSEIDEISSAYKKLDTFSLSAAKTLLKNKYNYGKLKFVAAFTKSS